MSDFPFEDFKKQLASFLKDNFRACDSFVEQIEKAKDVVEIRSIVRRHRDEIAENIGAFEDELDRLEELEDEVKGLRRDVAHFTNKPPVKMSLEDEYKIEAFQKYKNEYKLEDFEWILENGNKILAMKK